MSIVYRHFRNPDTPALVALWNQALTTRGAAVISKPNLLEAHMMAKPWFDPRGVQVAIDSDAPEGQHVVGVAVAGFGVGEQAYRIDRERGVIALVMVHPQHRRKRIGTTLLQAAEAYLRAAGTREAQAGSGGSRKPYFWGLLGGSVPPGVLASFTGAREFLLAQGYQMGQRWIVLARDSDTPVSLGDPRFPALRRKFSFNYHPRRAATWIDEALQGCLEAVIFELLETAVEKPVAEVRVWDMAAFVPKSGSARAGLYGLEVDADWRRQGLGKYLLCLVLQHLEDQMYGQIETAVAAEEETAHKLLTQLRFAQIDEGFLYTKSLGS